MLDATQLIQNFQVKSNKLLELQKQIYKDFYPFIELFPVDFDENLYSVEAVFNYTKLNLVSIIEKGERFLLQVLYKIDIPEHQFLNIISKENFIGVLLYQIILREIDKIKFREKFSK
jgi:hypothetical protein